MAIQLGCLPTGRNGDGIFGNGDVIAAVYIAATTLQGTEHLVIAPKSNTNGTSNCPFRYMLQSPRCCHADRR